MPVSTLEITAAVLFALAVLHTFCVDSFRAMANRHPEGSVLENVFHLLGEVEVVFGIWAGLLFLATMLFNGAPSAIHSIESLNFTEPAFVFVIMTIASTSPVLRFASGLLSTISRAIPLPGWRAFYFTALVVGPLLGSVLTEPAAMTVTALLLKERFFDGAVSNRAKYVTLGTLFVNISIGGVLTHFAAPPVLMVAGTWGWGTSYLFSHFGWKAVIAVTINSAIASYLTRKEPVVIVEKLGSGAKRLPPVWLIIVHLAVLAMVVSTAHHMTIFVGIFLFFLGIVAVTDEYQETLKIKESLLVAFFLAGLVVIGSVQSWWLQPILARLSPLPLYLGSAALTAVFDNAALTYLGSQVQGITDAMKYALVAGAVAGGGLTVIANAPNPAGYSILRLSFGDKGIAARGLLVGALVPTLVSLLCFWFL